MIKLKAHIARFFSLLVVLLITSNIGFCALEFNPFKDHSVNKQSVHLKDGIVFQKTDDSLQGQIIALEKDQQELEFDLFLDEVYLTAFICFLVFISTTEQNFYKEKAYSDSIPLWIKHLQIRL